MIAGVQHQGVELPPHDLPAEMLHEAIGVMRQRADPFASSLPALRALKTDLVLVETRAEGKGPGDGFQPAPSDLPGQVQQGV
ncbi:MAG: hypothetical protein B1H04_06375, partial [Planctomycetales bacterium 4484_123]